MKIAVVGGGISGLVSAWLLQPEHEVTVFEAADWIGGHSHTVDVADEGGSRAIDTGFIVYNERNYPVFSRVLEKLGVETLPTEMSFSVSDAQLGLEYKGSTLGGLFAQRRNLIRPAYWRMLRDIMRFNREAKARLGAPDDRSTLGDLTETGQYGRFFDEAYLRPMGAAIWSAPTETMRAFPLRAFARFFENHGLLDLKDRPQWRVVRGGSREYVERLTRPFLDRIRLSTPIRSIRRHADSVTVEPVDGAPLTFDRVIIATHSDQALAMLADPSDVEREVLRAIAYQPNAVTLHTDRQRLPKRRNAWSSWNVMREPGARETDDIAVTYHMNTLQRLDAPRDYCVSLNQDPLIDPQARLGSWTYAHPVYTQATLDAQQRRGEINGARNTFYCGAYWGYGFHEDGARSGLEVARAFGMELN